MHQVQGSVVRVDLPSNEDEPQVICSLNSLKGDYIGYILGLNFLKGWVL